MGTRPQGFSGSANRVRCVLFTLSLCLVPACGDDPVAPSPPPPPACQTNNTGTIAFENRHATFTYTVFWNGVSVTFLSPGQRSDALTAAAGVPHQLRFVYTNTSVIACTANPILTQCAQQTVFCAF